MISSTEFEILNNTSALLSTIKLFKTDNWLNKAELINLKFDYKEPNGSDRDKH